MDKVMFEMHDHEEANHWWFVARRRIVIDILGRHLRTQRPRILDLGCGTGGTLVALSGLGTVYGVEPSVEAAAIARRKGVAEVRLGQLPNEIPFQDESFDVITMLDVLEHVEDDSASLLRVRALLRPDGLFVCTVPALMSLWSSHDVLNHHYRRYRLGELRKKVIDAGFTVERGSYFNTILFIPIALIRRFDRFRRNRNMPVTGNVRGFLNSALAVLFSLERHAIRLFPLPIGVSAVLIARKPA